MQTLKLMPLLTASCLALLLASGCASTGGPEQGRDSHPQDPFEPVNRAVFGFNSVVDEFVLRPVAVGYETVTPKPMRWNIRNFFDNVTYPVTIANLALQGKLGDSAHASGRFLANSTFGLLGLFDVATVMGLERHNEDFGQTLGVWGIEESPYLVLPFLGPSTVRDGIGRFPDSYLFDPLSIYTRENTDYGPMALDLIQTRQQFLSQDQEIRQAVDPYAMMRDAYLQRRDFLIRDGETETLDYESMLEDYD